MSAIQHFIAASNTGGSDSTGYYPPVSGRSVVSLTEADKQLTYNVAGTIRNLLIRISANDTTTASTFRLRVNGANGSQSVSISAGTTGDFQDTTNSDAISAGDEVAYQLVSGSTGSVTPFVMSSVFTATTNTVSYVGSGSSLSINTASATRFLNYCNDNTANGTATESIANSQISGAGTLKHLYIYVATNTRTTSVVFTSRKNSGNGNMTVTVAGLATGVFEDTSNTDSIAAGDLVALQFVSDTGGGTTAIRLISAAFESSSLQGPIFFSRVAGSTESAGFTTYLTVGSDQQFDGADDTRAAVLTTIAASVTNLWMNVIVNGTSGASTVTTRVDHADGVNVLSIGAGATGEFEDTTHTDFMLDAGRDFGLKIVNGGGGNLTYGGLSALLTTSTVRKFILT